MIKLFSSDEHYDSDKYASFLQQLMHEMFTQQSHVAFMVITGRYNRATNLWYKIIIKY